jgi:alkylation response protein AidB-like acyl-CoA dehydrogenase
MDYGFNEEQRILQQTVRQFAEEVIKPTCRANDENEVFDVAIAKQMMALGLFGITVSPEYGGMGTDYTSYCLVVEELARVDAGAAATVAAGNSLGIGPLYYFGSEAQKQKYLPRLCTEKLWGFGLTEPEAGSDAGGSKTSGVLKNGRWTLNGSKIFITNAASTLTLGSTIQCITGKDADGKKEVSCVLVEQGTPGFTQKEMHHKLCWRTSNTAELYLDDAEVPEENLLGKRGDGFKQMMQTLDSGRLAIAAMGVGGAQGAFEAALQYANERKQFGRTIGKNQAIAFRIADMATDIEATRALLYKACWLRDQKKPFQKEAAMAKLHASEVMKRVAHGAVQVFGGYGLMEEYPVAKFYRDQRLLEIGEGTSEVQRMVIARKLGL